MSHKMNAIQQVQSLFSHWALRLLLVLLALAFIYALIVFGLILTEVRSQPENNINLVIVLGAQVKGEAPARPSQQLEERLDAAVSYLESNPDAQVLVTGGQGADEWEAEADVMARYLMEAGITSERILVENRSVSTIENFSLGIQLLDPSQVQDSVYTGEAVVVTNDYHMYRSLRSARQNGFPKVHGLSAVSRSQSTLKSYVREVIALGYHLIFSR